MKVILLVLELKLSFGMSSFENREETSKKEQVNQILKDNCKNLYVVILSIVYSIAVAALIFKFLTNSGGINYFA